VLKFLRFIDDASVPTDTWNEYKNKAKASQVMASVIKSSYDKLFETYPDAEKRDKATIQNFFASTFGVSATLADLMEQTFRQLSGLADFETAEVAEQIEKPSVPPAKEIAKAATSVSPIVININIQLQLPATENVEIYDNLFASMKKHLFP